MFLITQGDSSPSMLMTIVDDDVDLVGASVVMRWRRPDGTIVEDVPITIVDAVAKTVRRDFTSAETAIVGKHKGQLVVTKTGQIRSYPTDASNSFIEWDVKKKLA